MTYGPAARIAALRITPSVDKPYAPPSQIIFICRERMRPSRISPMRSTVRDGWRLAVEMIDSSRVTASRTHDEAHFADRLGNDARQHVAMMGNVLIGGNDRHDAVLVDIGEPCFRLEIGVLDLLRRIRF